MLVVVIVGCEQRPASHPAAVESGEAILVVGQPWAEARAVAARAGYELHDASQLDMNPTPDGFYIDMPGQRGLVVYRDSRRDVVRLIDEIDNWPGPKVGRVHHDMRSFDLPLAGPGSR